MAALSNFSSTLEDNGVLRYSAIAPFGSLTSMEIATSIINCSPRIISAQQPLSTDLVLDVLQKHDINTILMFPFSVAALAKRVLTENYDLTKLTTILSVGTSLSEATRNNLAKTLPTVEIRLKYGMPEIGDVSYSNANSKHGSLGYLVAGMSAKVSGRVIV